MTAREVVARIRAALEGQGIAWREQTVDTFKAGNPDTQVRGIATTGMATFDVLRRAAAAGRNFIISHEPTFYNHLDSTEALQGDPVYAAKQRFIAEHDLVVWRFHDHAHLLRPDPLVAGSARALGWTELAAPGNPRLYLVPPTTLRELASQLSRRLGARAIRVAGDPEMWVTRIAFGPGYGVPALIPDVDVAVGGETAEAIGNEHYIRDSSAAGAPKGMILLGHMLSEDFGMLEAAEWLRPLLPGTPIEWISAGEPFSPTA